MASIDLFSQRKAAAEGALPPPQTDVLPETFRKHLRFVLDDMVGKWNAAVAAIPGQFLPNRMWAEIDRVLRREYARGPSTSGGAPYYDCLALIEKAPADEVLDLVEVAFAVVGREFPTPPAPSLLKVHCLEISAAQAAAEFNKRCLENGVGYRLADGKIIPATSAFAHTQLVEPALALLHQNEFRGARDEFLAAFAHLRRGDHKAAVVEVLKAFESAMKTICTQRGWPYDPARATAKDLIAVLFANGFIPPYLQTQFAGLRSLLESGVPTVRNKNGGHGQGPEPVQVARGMAEYAIHLTAANIVFLVSLL